MTLTVVMYHYVRDLPNTRFPAIKGMLTAVFARQVAALCDRYEMATLESTLAFLAGRHVPSRPMCLLTFDDALADHYTDVLPILARARVQGQFFIPTRSIEEGFVADVHKNHFLMAELPFADYRRRFLERLDHVLPGGAPAIDEAAAVKKYRWDTPDVAAFKYLLNFGLSDETRGAVLAALFADVFGDEKVFARELYLSWQQAREMQRDGMLLGGHSDAHRSLASLSNDQQQADLQRCWSTLTERTNQQSLWPFSYPFGHAESFNDATIDCLRRLGFDCAFTTLTGGNARGEDRYRIRRIDPKDVKDA